VTVGAVRITVVGAGAIGGFVGAKLAAAGEDVTLVDASAEHVEAIRADGLHVSGAAELRVRPPVFVPASFDGQLETVLLAVKARHTADAVDWIAPRLHESGCVVSLQNGLQEPLIAGLVGAERTIGTFLSFGGFYAGPGEIVFGGEGSFRIGELDGRASDRIAALAELLERAHPVAVTDRIMSFAWGKTAVEAWYFATALLDADVVDIIDRGDGLRELGELVAEVARVAAAEGEPCAPIDGFDPNVFADGDAEDKAASWLAQRRYWDGHISRRTGVWRDLAERRRPTDVDGILAPVVEIAERHGIETPGLRRLIALVHDAETGKLALGLPTLAALAG
jgi:2-dehydropantoate 2-reductase